MKKIIYILPFLFFACSGNNSSQTETVVSDQPNVSEPEPEASNEPQEVSAGQQVYERVCLVCHQHDGGGVPGMYPPITDSEWVQGDKERLINIVLNGLNEPMTIKGEKYTAIMPAQDFLSDQEIADVLTYVRSHFGNDAGPITSEEVAAERAKETS